MVDTSKAKMWEKKVETVTFVQSILFSPDRVQTKLNFTTFLQSLSYEFMRSAAGKHLVKDPGELQNRVMVTKINNLFPPSWWFIKY